jgi:hypothetical protein
MPRPVAPKPATEPAAKKPEGPARAAVAPRALEPREAKPAVIMPAERKLAATMLEERKPVGIMPVERKREVTTQGECRPAASRWAGSILKESRFTEPPRSQQLFTRLDRLRCRCQPTPGLARPIPPVEVHTSAESRLVESKRAGLTPLGPRPEESKLGEPKLAVPARLKPEREKPKLARPTPPEPKAGKPRPGAPKAENKSADVEGEVKTLLTATAVIEFGAGLGLLFCPSAMVALLVGAPLETPAALTAARVGGAGVLSLGVACWLARTDAQSRAARGLMAAMFIYNVATAALLAYAGIGFGLYGVALWPGVALHAAMAVWCAAHLRVRK